MVGKKSGSLQGLYFSLIINYGESTEQEFSVPYSNLVSFEHSRVVDNKGNTFKLTLLGELSIDLEYNLLSSKDHKVKIIYGYSLSESRVFVGQVTGCDIHFEDMAVAISISGTAAITQEDKSSRSCVWEKGTKLSKIISLICNAHKWGIGFVIDSEPLPQNVTQSNMSDSSFLADVLPEYLCTKEGISDYKLWFTYKGSKLQLNYAPLCYCRSSGGEYIFDLFSKENSSLLSFEVNNVGEAAFSYGSEIGSAVMDSKTGKMKFTSSNNVSKSLSNLAKQAGNLYGRRDIFYSNNNTMINTTSGTSLTAVNYYWSKMYAMAYEASASILGDVFLDAGTVITIIVLMKNGKAHYSSGFYTVTSVTDKIDSNGFITELGLVKTLGSNVGSVVS